MRLKIVAFLCTFGCSARLTVCLCAAEHNERRTYDILQDILRVSRRRFTFHSIRSVRVVLTTIDLVRHLCSWTKRKLATILHSGIGGLSIILRWPISPRLVLRAFIPNRVNFQEVIILIWSCAIHFSYSFGMKHTRVKLKMKWGLLNSVNSHCYTIEKFSMRSIQELTATIQNSSHFTLITGTYRGSVILFQSIFVGSNRRRPQNFNEESVEWLRAVLNLWCDKIDHRFVATTQMRNNTFHNAIRSR